MGNFYMPPMRSDELMHTGVLGMHWGIRRYQNPDGTLTPLGKERYQKSLYKSIKGKTSLDAHNNAKPIAKKVASDRASELKEAKEKLNNTQTSKMSKDYYKNLNKYSKMAADFNSDSQGITDKEERERMRWLYTHDDLDQGWCNSSLFYVLSKGKSDKDISNMLNESFDAVNEYEKKCKDIANDVLGKYADMPVGKTKYNNSHVKAGEVLTRQLQDSTDGFFDGLAYELQDAVSGANIDEVRKWIKNYKG